MIKKKTLAKLSTNQIIGCVVWNYDNLIESILKQIIKTNSKSTKCWRMKLKKKYKKNSIERKTNERCN
jgi:hypothetical protein